MAETALRSGEQRVARYNALRLGFAVGMLLVGGFLGRWYATSPGWKQAARIVASVWLVFGLGVYTVLGAGLFGQHLQAGPVWHALSLLIIFGVFGVALYEAYAALERRAVGAPVSATRRTLLRTTALAMMATVGAGGVWRIL